MKSPITGKEMIVGKELRDMTYRKETFQVWFHYYQCEDTKEKFEDEQFAELNYNQVINQYRVRHHIPFPEEIRKIRLQYDLSATKMSEILGLGTNSWRNYENGEVPSTAIASLIHTMAKPENFIQQIRLYCSIADKEKEKIIKYAQKLINDSQNCVDPLYRFNYLPDLSTGFKAFDREKTEQVISFFCRTIATIQNQTEQVTFLSGFCSF